ncbi:MAG: prepilin-type N-terminal cleavage/methylation domain-containing protein [Variovorax sp.]|jgi:type IV pilus assembly protein PilE|nr:MAG: prepilin-type N-terminal cleavage/methylation domain-containing protein [Variovorax sp.]
MTLHAAAFALRPRKLLVRGFTLIELMVTVAILAILSAIALPIYSEYVMRGRIPEALSGLSDMRVKMEQYFQDNRTYIGACANNTVAPIPPDTTSFTFSCPTLTASTYVIMAKGISTKTMNAFEYTIAQDGTRRTTALPTGWTGASGTSTCWVTSKGGTC